MKGKRWEKTNFLMISITELVMRGLYIILFGLLGLMIFGCIELPAGTQQDGPEVITTTDQECPGCANEEETPPEVETPPIEEPIQVENETTTEENETAEEPTAELTLEEAKAIADNSTCSETGIVSDVVVLDSATNEWEFVMEVVEEGCNAVCVVSQDGTAKVQWDCGDEEPVENETDKYANATGCVGPSDVSYDIFKKEEVWYEGTIHEDTCTLATIVKQYYCKDGQVKDISQECPSDYDCRDGACKPVEYTCSKTFGNDTTIKGHIVVAKGLNPTVDEYDECIDDGMIKEWVCTASGHAEALELYCGSGMRCAEGEGRCVKSTCLETDAGDDPEHFGKITFKDKDDEYSDTCTDDYKLREYYCYGDGIKSKNYRCSDECYEDECTPIVE